MRDEQLLAYLKGSCSGRKNRVGGTELERTLHVSGTDLRKLVNQLRRKTHPIASDRSGYFYREMIRYLYQALAQLEVAEQALIRADFFLMKTEAECAKAAGISQPGYRKRRDRILRKLRKSLKECAPKDFQEILEKWL